MRETGVRTLVTAAVITQGVTGAIVLLLGPVAWMVAGDTVRGLKGTALIESARDHETVVEVLASFIRNSATEEGGVPEPDVVAALIVLGRRRDRRERYRIDLRGAQLSGVSLTFGARLARADLRESKLLGADLAGADLSGACLDDADLSGANLHRADLTGTWMLSASLRDARLENARRRLAEGWNSPAGTTCTVLRAVATPVRRWR